MRLEREAKKELGRGNGFPPVLRARVLAGQYAITRLLAESTSLHEAIPGILNTVCEMLDWDVGAFWEIDSNEKELCCIQTWHRAGTDFPAFEEATRSSTFEKGIGLPGRVWASGRAQWILDVQGDENFPRAPYALKENLRSGFAFPVVLRADFLGVVEFFSRRPRQPDSELLDAMSALGSQLGQFMERTRAQADLRRSKEELDEFFENASIGLHWMDAEGTILRANHAELALVGYSAEEYVGHNIAEFHADQNAMKDVLRRLSAGETIEEYPARLRCKDGSIRDVLINSSVYWENGRFVHTRCFTRDVTDRRRAEARLEQRLQQLTSIHQLVEAVSRTGAPEEIYELALDAIMRALAADRAALLLFDADGLMRFKTWRGLSEKYREAVTGHSPWAIDESQPEPIAVADVESEPSLAELRTVILNEGIRALAFIPLCTRGRLLGKFMLYYDHPHPLNREDLALATTIANNVAFAIERRRAEEAFEYQTRINKTITDNAASCLFMMDAQGYPTFMNPATEVATGYTLEEIRGKPVHSSIHFARPDGTPYPMSECPIESASHNLVVSSGEETFIRKDGTSFPVSYTVSPLEKGGRLLGAVLEFRDVTEERGIREGLRESEERFRRLATQAPVGIFVTDRQGDCLYVNEKWCQLTGLSPMEASGRGWVKALHPEDAEQVAQEWYDAAAAGGEFASEYRFRTPQGEVNWVAGSARPVIIEQAGAVSGYLGTVTDITARKVAEEDKEELLRELERQRERINNVVSNVPGVVWEAWGEPDDAEQRIEFVSGYVEQMLGYGVQEWLSTPNFWLAIVHPDDKERTGAAVAGLFKRGEGGATQFRWVRKDGDVIWVECHSTVIKDEAGNPVGMRGVTMDISERKRAEVALRQSEAKYRGIFQSVGVAVWEEDFTQVSRMLERLRQEGVTDLRLYLHDHPQFLREAVAAVRVTDVNERAVDLHRAKSKDDLKASLEQVFLPETLVAFADELVALWEGQPYLESETALRTLDGRRLDVIFSIAFGAGSSGAEQVLVSVLDISERKRAEEALAASERYFRALIDTSPSFVWTAAADGAVDYYSESFYQYTGLTPADSTGWAWQTTDVVHPDEYDELVRRWIEAVERGEPYEMQVRLKGADGIYRWYLDRAVPIRDDSGAVVSWVGTGTEVQVQKEAEEALHVSREREAFLAEISAVLSSSLDYQVTLNNVAQLITGTMADVCSIDVVGDGNLVTRVALAHVDPDKARALAAMDPIYKPASRKHPVIRVARSRRAELYGQVPEELLKSGARDEAHLEKLRALGIRSAMVVPLAAGERAHGAITFARMREPAYGEDDLRLAREVARRAGIAIDNALRYQDEQRARAEAEEARREAERAAGRTARLQELTAALSEALTAARVGEIMIEAAAGSLGARSGLVARITPDGTGFQVLAKQGVSKEFAGRGGPLLEHPPKSILKAVKGGKPLFLSSREALLKKFPELADFPTVGERAFACIPLMLENRAIGAMVLTFESGRGATAEERDFVIALAGQCAQALERARLYEAEQASRRQAEATAHRIARLQGVSAALAEAITPGQAAETVIEQAVAALGARAGAVAAVGDDGGHLILLAQSGYTEAVVENWQSVDVAAPLPQTDVLRTGAPLFVSSRAELEERFPAVRELPHSGYQAVAIMPLTVEGRAIGVAGISFAEERQFSEDEKALVIAIARIGAQALDRARLYEAEKSARGEAEAAQERQRFLAEASAILSSSLDYETTLEGLARMCVPRLGDWCAVDLLSDGQLERVSVVHTDPAKVQLAREFQERYPPDIDDPGLQEVLVHGRSRFFPEIPDELVKEAIDDEEGQRIVRALGLKSAITVPLYARGRTLGQLTLVTAESGRVYTEEDLRLVEDLGRRAGLAVDNARLYRESQDIQEELRRANEAKDEFLGLVSHELRTPITTVYGGARLMRARADKLDAQSRDGILADIEHEAERLHRIVEDLLVLARLELGQEVITEPVLVQRVIEKAVAAVGKRRPGRRIELELEPELEPAAASAVYLEQILRNLISNADKYSPDDQPIALSAYRSPPVSQSRSAAPSGAEEGVRPPEVCISVRDRGPGIPAEEVELIFERFYRSEGTAGKAGGAGIGLTVCRRLVQAQNGRIWAENMPDGGLRISLCLPAYREA